MARQLRIEYEHAFYHVISRGGRPRSTHFPSTLNRELVGEIHTFGGQVEVLEPGDLMKEIAAIAGGIGVRSFIITFNEKRLSVLDFVTLRFS